jgi:hypothetical protein
MILPQDQLPDDVDGVADRAPLEFPPAIDPVFWGTGDLLVWEADHLLKLIDKDKLCSRVRSLVTAAGMPFEKMDPERLKTECTALCKELSSCNLVLPRGYYGFFPVITEHDSIVLLDPSDYHSELLSIVCLPVKKLAGRSLADFYRPEGDVLAISAVTLGPDIDRHLATNSSDPALAGQTAFLREIVREVLQILVNKISIEVRRGLGIEGTTGAAFELFDGLVDNSCIRTLFELCGFEERLCIESAGAQTYAPSMSSVQVFAHHPQINNFVYFGT